MPGFLKVGRKDFGIFLGRQDSRRLSGWLERKCERDPGRVREAVQEAERTERNRTDGRMECLECGTVLKWNGMFGMQLTVWEQKKGGSVKESWP